jgi:hypothetical protein
MLRWSLITKINIETTYNTFIGVKGSSGRALEHSTVVGAGIVRRATAISSTSVHCMAVGKQMSMSEHMGRLTRGGSCSVTTQFGWQRGRAVQPGLEKGWHD